MASTTKSLRSGTANKRPTTAIAEGQIALNTNATSPGLYFKDSTGAAIIKIGPVHVGTTAPNVAPAGSSGNSTGEAWLDTSLTPNGWKVWTGAAWVNATPAGSETVQGLLELATNAETQAGSDTARAVTPAGLQSKVSDSTSTTSSTTIASSTAVKAANDLATAALPKAGGTVTGNLEIGNTGSLTFEGATADAFETTLAVVDPTADRTITLPNVTGTVVTTGDTGSVTSTMILDGTILNADVNASAAIAGTKISPDFGSQNIVTTGGLTVDTNTLYVDATSNCVGIGTTGPSTYVQDNGLAVYRNANNSQPHFNVVNASTGGSAASVLQVLGGGGSCLISATSSGWGDYGILKTASTTIEAQANWLSFGAPNGFIFGTGANPYAEKLRIDSNGRLLVGISSSRFSRFNAFDFQSSLQIESDLEAAQSITRWSTDPNCSRLHLQKGRGTIASPAVIANNDLFGEISFSGYDSANMTNGARISAEVDGTPGTNDMPGRLVFSTTADGAASPTERMRISSNGSVGIGAVNTGKALVVNSATITDIGAFENANASATGSCVVVATARAAGTSAYFIYGLANSVATIAITNNGDVRNQNNVYAAISDSKLKENIVDANSQWDDLKALQVRNYNLKEGQTHTQIGLVAQEVELVSPGLVSESPDRDEEGNDLGTVTKSVNYSVLYMKAVKALQEAMERIETLEARLTAAGIA
jgi:hypothetical protein